MPTSTPSRRQQTGALDPGAGDQRRRAGRGDPEAQHRQAGEQADRGARHPEIGDQVGGDRGDGDQRTAQVERQQHEPGQQQGRNERAAAPVWSAHVSGLAAPRNVLQCLDHQGVVIGLRQAGHGDRADRRRRLAR